MKVVGTYTGIMIGVIKYSGALNDFCRRRACGVLHFEQVRLESSSWFTKFCSVWLHNPFSGKKQLSFSLRTAV